MENTEQLVVMCVLVLALALCFWRWPQGDLWYVVLCLAIALWGSLLVFVLNRTGFVGGLFP